MARETKAQREARLELERQERLAVAKATYVERMMSVLRRATKQNFELTVSLSDSFLVSDRDDNSSYFYVSPAWSEQADMNLNELEWSVESKEERAAEAERRANVRANALAKLTAEERELLKL
jgi:hypothetical protein